MRIMEITEKILKDITDFCQANKISGQQLGISAIGCHKIIKRIKNRSMKLITIEKIYSFMGSYKGNKKTTIDDIN